MHLFVEFCQFTVVFYHFAKPWKPCTASSIALGFSSACWVLFLGCLFSEIRKEDFLM